ncbi:hypothetical protein HY491_00580 [Candidatus Woesearchaeota archaeon]|nr:hypothetical protein [Candidatus Woesearchaeota archaeon]
MPDHSGVLYYPMRDDAMLSTPLSISSIISRTPPLLFLVLLSVFLIPPVSAAAVRIFPFAASNTLCEDRYYNISITAPGFGYDVQDNLANLAGWSYTGLGGDALQECAIQPGNSQVICSAVAQNAPRMLQFFVANAPGQSAAVFDGTYYDEQANLGQPITGGSGQLTILPAICGGDDDGDTYYAGAPPENICGCTGGNDCLPNDPTSHPFAFDVPNDNIDQDCCNGDAPNFITITRTLPGSITSTTLVRLTINSAGSCNTVKIAERFPTALFDCNTVSNNGICDENKGTVNWTIDSTQVSEVSYTLALSNPASCYSFSGIYIYAGQERGIGGKGQQGAACSCPYYGEEVCGNTIDEDCNDNIAVCKNGCTPTNSAIDICGNTIDENCDGSDSICSSAFTPNCQPRNGGVDICGNSIDEDCNGADAVCSPSDCTPTNRGVEICNNGGDENCDGRDDACSPSCAQGYIGDELCGNSIDENCDGVIDSCISGTYPNNARLPPGQTCSGFTDFSSCQGNEICGNAVDENCDGIVESCLAPSCTLSDSGSGMGCEVCGNTFDEDCDGFPDQCTASCLPGFPSPPEICGNELDEDCDGVDNACIPCNLLSAAVTPNCAGGVKSGCEFGETLTIAAVYDGDCPDTSAIQVDADDLTNQACIFEQNGAASGGISGASILCTSSPCTATWAFPGIPSACQNKRMSASFAVLYRDFVGGSAISSTSPTGSFEIGEPCRDDDGDGYGPAGGTAGCVSPSADCCDAGSEPMPGCSATTRASIHPGAAETPANAGVDNDCNPATDIDNDGYTFNDCNDNTAAVNPGAQDTIANPGVDNDCDPSTDIDNDGYTDADCNDNNPNMNPGVPDTLANPGINNDCNPTTDTDNDGYLLPQDCNDNNNNINPGLRETCDNLDNNCALGVDDGCDDDNDNYCDALMTVKGAPTTCTSGGNDCNDNDPNDRPGSSAYCISGSTCAARDQDNDGYLNTQCSGGNDCNDNDPNAYPGASAEPVGTTTDTNCDGKAWIWRTTGQTRYDNPVNRCGMKFQPNEPYATSYCQDKGQTDYISYDRTFGSGSISTSYYTCDNIRNPWDYFTSITCRKDDWVYDYVDSDGDGYGVPQGDCNDHDARFHPGQARELGWTDVNRLGWTGAEPDFDCDGKTWMNNDYAFLAFNPPTANGYLLATNPNYGGSVANANYFCYSRGYAYADSAYNDYERYVNPPRTRSYPIFNRATGLSWGSASQSDTWYVSSVFCRGSYGSPSSCANDCDPSSFAAGCSDIYASSYCGNCDADACTEVCTSSCGTYTVNPPNTAYGSCSCQYACSGSGQCSTSCNPYPSSCRCAAGYYNCDGSWSNGCESTVNCCVSTAGQTCNSCNGVYQCDGSCPICTNCAPGQYYNPSANPPGCVQCGGIEVDSAQYYCGVADNVCPSSFGADCSSCTDIDCGGG